MAMIANITSSIGMAAVGAEQDATANLVPAVMFLAVAVAVSLVAVLAAFEVLAAIYLRDSTKLFAIITGGLTARVPTPDSSAGKDRISDMGGMREIQRDQ